MSDCLYGCVYTNTGMYACARTYAPVCVSGGVCVCTCDIIYVYDCMYMQVCNMYYTTCIWCNVYYTTDYTTDDIVYAKL